MTDEMKGDGMTLQEVSAKLRAYAAEGRLSDRYTQMLRKSAIAMADSIDANLAAQSAKVDVPPDFPLGAIENGRVFADRLEQTDLSCVAGGLHLCVDWHEFRQCFEYMAEWCMGQAAQSAMRVGERAAFEAWWKTQAGSANSPMKETWDAWQARAAIQAATSNPQP